MFAFVVDGMIDLTLQVGICLLSRLLLPSSYMRPARATAICSTNSVSLYVDLTSMFGHDVIRTAASASLVFA